MFLNDNLKNILVSKGITANALACELGLTAPSVYAWLRDEDPTCPSWKNIQRIIDFLKIPPLALFGDINLEHLSEEQKILLENFAYLDKDDKLLVSNMIERLKKLHSENYDLKKRNQL